MPDSWQRIDPRWVNHSGMQAFAVSLLPPMSPKFFRTSDLARAVGIHPNTVRQYVEINRPSNGEL